ncbi:MAG: hypothetical protein U1F68_02600 [Gammaproteobacteria bacterium]
MAGTHGFVNRYSTSTIGYIEESESLVNGTDRELTMAAEDDAKAKKMVIEVLKSPLIDKIKFTIGSFSIAPAMYEEVRKAIENDKIAVLVDTKSPPAGAEGIDAAYINDLRLENDTILYDLLVLRFLDLGESTKDEKERIKTYMTRTMMIVHECTHAAMDLRKVKKITHKSNEAAAYVAGALFIVASVRDLNGNPEKLEFKKQYGPAHKIALYLENAKEKVVPRKLLNELSTEIIKLPAYKDKADNIVTNDGVGRPWKLKGQATAQ